MATTVRQQYWPDGLLPLGLTHEELVNEGWIAYTLAPKAKFARARWAMVDLIRSALSPASGSLPHQGKLVGEAVSEELVWNAAQEEQRPPVRRSRLRRSDIGALRGACHRNLTPRAAAVAIRTLIDGESLALVASEMGIDHQHASVIRSKAFTRLLAVRGAP
jgi:hypothetical protein